MVKVLQCETNLNRSVITSIDLLHAAVEVNIVLSGSILLVKASIAVAGSLVLFIHEFVSTSALLVRGNEIDRGLYVPRIIAFILRLFQLFLSLVQHGNGIIIDIRVVELCE